MFELNTSAIQSKGKKKSKNVLNTSLSHFIINEYFNTKMVTVLGSRDGGMEHKFANAIAEALAYEGKIKL
jgi:hypothetical protein